MNSASLTLITQKGRVPMKFLRGTFIGLFCLVVGFLMVWQPLPAQAQGAAPAPGKPALYEFGAKYCIPCKEMKEVMAALKVSHGDQVEFRMVYTDEEMPLFEKYKIVAIPTQVFFDASGKVVDQHIGALPKEEVLKKLKELKFIR
jgi:thioredoxin 1